SRPAHERAHRQRPEPPELLGEPLRRVVPAPEDPLAVRRHERQRGDTRPLDSGDDELGGVARKPTEAALLPRAHEPADALVVLDRRPRGGEREATARALPAAAHGPRGRRPTAL